MRGFLGMLLVSAAALSGCGGGGGQMSGPPPPPPAEPMLSLLAGGPGGPGNADGTGTAARFTAPRGAALDSTGNLYLADAGNDTIRKITPDGAVSTFAGTAGVTGSTDGSGAGARFDLPSGVAVDSAANVYIADTENHTIRKITSADAVTTTVGQPGEIGFLPGSLPALSSAPKSVALFESTLYTTTNNAIVRVTNLP